MENQRFNPEQIEEQLTPEQEAELRRQAFERYDRLEKPAETIGNMVLSYAIGQNLLTGNPSTGGGAIAPESLDQTLVNLTTTVNLATPKEVQANTLYKGTPYKQLR